MLFTPPLRRRRTFEMNQSALLMLAMTLLVQVDGGGGSAANLDPPSFNRLAQEKRGLVLDVRTPAETAQGHLPGASFIDVRDPQFEKKASRIDKQRPVFVYCASGGRSATAASTLQRLGFKEVYNLAGGIRAWKSAGLPVETSAAPSTPSSAAPLSIEAFDALLAKDSRVLADFQTPWCTPCQTMAPIVEALREKWAGKATVIRVDVDQSDALAARERIEGIPTFVLYVGGKERWRQTGEVPRDVLEAQLATALGK